jgi:hypothetical protein
MRRMTRFHFTNGLLISTLALAAAACSSDSKTPTPGDKDGGTGGSTSSSGGSTSSTGGGGAKSTGGTTGSTGGTTGSTGGTTTATGGATSNTDGGKSTGGTKGDAGESDAAIAATCEVYCTANIVACTGANKQYDGKAACLTACANFPTTGKDGDTSGNTLQCRIYHTGAAATDPALHCPHTGVTPTAYCK